MRGYQVGRRKAGKYMREMGPNQAWSIGITYIPMKHGFLYLTAIIDWYSRCIVGWYVDNTLDNMYGKSRWADNIIIRRWFRSFKYEETYLTEYTDLKEVREAIVRYIYTYNFERCHPAIDNKRPAEVYYPAMLSDTARETA